MARVLNRVSFYELMQFYPDADLLPFEFNKETTLEDVKDLVDSCGDPLFMLLAYELCNHKSDKIDLATSLNRLMSIGRQLQAVENAVRNKFCQLIRQQQAKNEKRRKSRKAVK